MIETSGGATPGLEGPILLFDGVCNLCAGTVRFVVPRDRDGRFRFASLQSDVGQGLLERVGLGLDPDNASAWTLVLIENGRGHVRSSAALRTARHLGRGWPILTGLLAVPRPLRDLVYRWVARNRYRWFGRKDVCYVPERDESWRFLDSEA